MIMRILWGVGGVLLIIGIPILIDLVFSGNMQAADWLSYYGSVLGGVVSFVVLYITLKNETKERIIAENRSKRVYLDVNFWVGGKVDLSDRKDDRKNSRIYYLNEKEEYRSRINEPVEFLEISNYANEGVHNLVISLAYKKIKKEKGVSRIRIAQMRPESKVFVLLPLDVTCCPNNEDMPTHIRERHEVVVDKVSVKYTSPAGERLKCEILGDSDITTYYLIDEKQKKKRILFEGKNTHCGHYITDE